MIIMIRKYLYILCNLFILFYFAIPAQSARKYKITFIQSYEEQNYWNSELLKGFNDGLKEQGLEADIHTEYLNSWFWEKDSEEFIMRRILQRANKWQSDIIATFGDEATYSLMACNSPVAHKIPTIYSSVKYPNYPLLAHYPNISGKQESQDFITLMNISKKIFPKRKTFIVTSENGALGNAAFSKFIRQWMIFHKRNPDYKLKFINISDKIAAKIVKLLRFNINIRDDVLLVPLYNQNIKWIMRLAACPCISTNINAVPNGAFATYSEKEYDLGYNAGTRTALFFKHSHIKDSLKTNKILACDWKQIKYFHCTKDLIPKDAVIINELLSEKYFTLLIIVSSLLFMALILSLIYIMNRIKNDSQRKMMVITQNALLEQRNDFESIFNSILFGVISLNKNNQIHLINHTALNLMQIPFGVKDEYAIDKPINEFMEIICGRQNILPIMLNAINGKDKNISIPPQSFMLIKCSNTSFPISGDFTLIKKGPLSNGIIISFRNTTDELIMNNWLTLAMRVGKIYTYKFDRTIKQLYFSTGFLNLLGLQSHSSSMTFSDFINECVHSDDQRFAREILTKKENKRYTPSKKTSSIELRLKNNEGIYEWWKFDFSEFSNDNKLSTNLLGICQCIQNFKDREQELISARDRAMQSDKLKTEFLANMSHEIRTPLNSIVGFSAILSDIHSYSKGEIESFISIINSNCQTLLALIDDLIDLSSIESGATELFFSEFDLSILILEVINSRLLDKNNEVQIIEKFPENNIKLFSDRERLKQVLTNLITNAQKFTKKGFITIGYKVENDNVNIFIEDTGIGIPQDRIEKIFERFYKVNNYVQGAGIGLSICKTIINHLKGTIAVNSKIGIGTTFNVTIPIKEDGESSETPS